MVKKGHATANQEDVSEFYTIFVLTFQASMGFSVVKVIMGVFLQNTFAVAANDDVKLAGDSPRMPPGCPPHAPGCLGFGVI